MSKSKKISIFIGNQRLKKFKNEDELLDFQGMLEYVSWIKGLN